jgi:DNA-binding NtrC family response regulator
MTTTMTAPAEDADPILLVDDDATNLDVLRHTLDGRGYHLFVTRSGENAIEVAHRVHPLLILLDVVMPGIDGYETCRRLKEDPDTRDAAVIFLSSLDDTKDKVRGLQVGAVDFVSKPFQSEEVVARVNTHLTLQRLRRQLETRNSDLARELAVAQELLTDARRRVEGPLLGDSPAIRALRESIAKYAADSVPVLLTGPHGGGYEAAARGIHHASPRSRQAFIHVNCAMVAPGHDPGIFSAPATGAERAAEPRLSLLELATRGTLFLEEIQRLSADVQARLAEVLEGLEAAREAGQPGGARRAFHGVHVGPAHHGRRIPSEAARHVRAQTAASAVPRRALRGRRGDCHVLPPSTRAPDRRRGRADLRGVDEAAAEVPVARRRRRAAEPDRARR